MTDDEWAYFEPFLIRRGGRPPHNHRRVLDAVFWLMRTGAPWRDLPEEFGNWNSIFRQFGRMTAAWDVILEALAGSGLCDAALQMIDATVIRAHHCAGGGKGGPGATRSAGRAVASRPRSTPAPMLMVYRSASRSPPAEIHDVTAYPALMNDIDCDPEQMLGDKGYDSQAVRRDIEQRGGEAVIPSLSSRKIQHAVDKAVYALRNRIERFFNRAKNSRRVATRYDKLVESFGAFVLLACIRIWIRFVHTT